MVRCTEFYERWKRHPNFCEKSPAAVSRIDHYLTLVEDLESTGIDAALVYKNFPEGAAREVLKIKDEKTLEEVLFNAAGMIKRGQKVSRGDITTWAGMTKTEPKPRPVPTIVDSSISEPSVKSDEWTPEYEAKYPVTAACKAIGCFSLRYIKPGLHTCGFFGLRPENMPKGKLPDGCPKLPPVEPEPAQPAPAAPLQRVLTAPPSHPNLQRYTVEANRQDQMALRQMVQRGLAEDEDEAVQSCFEEGLNLIMDRIEAQIQKEEEDQEVLGE